MNTVALRARVRDEQSIEEYLEEIREQTLASFANQEVPFEQVVEAVTQPARSLSHALCFRYSSRCRTRLPRS